MSQISLKRILTKRFTFLHYLSVYFVPSWDRRDVDKRTHKYNATKDIPYSPILIAFFARFRKTYNKMSQQMSFSGIDLDVTVVLKLRQSID